MKKLLNTTSLSQRHKIIFEPYLDAFDREVLEAIFGEEYKPTKIERWSDDLPGNPWSINAT